MAFPSPALSPPTLQNYQFSYNGVTFGAGTAYSLQSVDGLDIAPIRTGDVGRPREQGELIGLDLLGGRDITIQLWVKTDGTSLQHGLNALAGALAVSGETEAPLWFQLPNQPLMAVMCRPRKYVVKIDSIYGAASIAMPSIMFHAVDPRVYAAPSLQPSVSLPTPAGGMTFNATFPLSFGGGSAAGVLTIVHTGNSEMRPILVITGPCTNPSVTNSSITGNPKLTFSNPSQVSTTLAAGDTLTVDLDLHTIVYTASGTTAGASRRAWLVAGSVWWNLLVGTNTLQFTSTDAGAVAGSLAAWWAPAYISAT